jgi:hypothetical protein
VVYSTHDPTGASEVRSHRNLQYKKNKNKTSKFLRSVRVVDLTVKNVSRLRDTPTLLIKRGV